ncbi:MAG TPA: hypothetical protein VFP97_03095 [Chitinophagaceae bacterium]|nr:hypothetical protein [Chitinophagaceae bacterium]
MIGLNKNIEVTKVSLRPPSRGALGKSILKTLAYFDIFRYPLTAEEIRSFLDQSCNEIDLITALQDLITTGKIFPLHEFYSLQNDISLINRRIQGNERAGSLLKTAERIASKIYKFPYVRAVGVSGSVSKNFADEQADIDYFIITKSNRLWIARTLLHIFKKNPFLKNRHRHYCMNYFVDEADLVIEEKNIYTATELFTLIPMAGNGIMKKFFEANCWSSVYFPNLSLPEINKENKPLPWYKKSMELFFNSRFGDWLENYFFRLTTKRWKKKEDEKRLNTKGERMGLKTGKHVSKPNPVFFHDWFVSRYESRLHEVIND